MSTTPVAATTADDLLRRLAALRHRVDGTVLVPGDPGFAEASAGWNLGSSHTPATVVVAADVGDVIAAVTFAAEAGLGLGVQATGHGMALPVDGVLLVTSRMDQLEVDPETHTAWVGAGCAWAPVLAAAQRHGLAPLVPSSTSVGAVGSTLGGGLGWLARRYGPACDAVRSFEVVAPTGELVQACRDEHPELFRALRGGGGGCLGVVTEMEIELFPVTTVYAGNLAYPAGAAGEVVAAWSAWVADAPDELTSSVVIEQQPDGPGAVFVRGCWCGDPAAGRQLVDQWRALMPPLDDDWRLLPFGEIDAISGHPRVPQPAVVDSGWLTDPPRGGGLPSEVGAILATATFGGDQTWRRYAEIRHNGGVVARGRAAAPSSMGNRDHQFLLQLVAVTPDVVAAADRLAATKAALGERLTSRTYLNGLDGPARCAAAATSIDAPDLAAIAALRAQLDPGELLRYGVDHRS
jgi:hypothetical protein